jgi:hypothetical protein
MHSWHKLISRHFFYALIILCSVVLGFLDWPLGNADKFYVAHPVIAGLISSGIPVAIGATAVKEYLDRQRNLRWKVASQVAYNSLSRAPLAQRRVMWLLLYGGGYVDDRDFILDSSLVADIDSILERHDLDQLSEATSFMDGRPDFESRLEVLVRVVEWQVAAYSALRDTSHGFRVIIARWASLLSSTPEGQETLKYVARQEKELTDLYIKLVPAARRGVKLDSDTRSEISAAWQRAFANSVVLNEYLAHKGEEYGTQNVKLGRHLLNTAQLQFLVERESRGEMVARLYES